MAEKSTTLAVSPIRSRALAALAVSLAAVLAGCEAPGPQPIGNTGLQATYTFGTLRTELPVRVSIPTAQAAAETCLQARGYVITRRSTSEDAAWVFGKQARTGPVSQLHIEIFPTATGTGVAIRAEPFGDEIVSRLVMEDVCARLMPPPK